MGNNKAIVCFSVNDWDDVPTSKTHIMRHLGQSRKVLYVETVGIRRPQVSSRDAKRAATKVVKFLSGLRNVENQVYTWSPLAIPFHGSAWADRFNSYVVTRFVKAFTKRLGIVDPIIWSYLPNVVSIIERLPNSRVIYHCIDDYAQFTDVPKVAFERMERRMLQQADLTVVSSQGLMASRKAHARKIEYIPHGVNLDEFRGFLNRPADLTDIDRISGPIAGFVGRIGDWVDLPLVMQCAATLPHWNFVLIGPTNVDLEPYRKMTNVHFLGRKEFWQVPHYIRRFDVCLIPFLSNSVVASMNPLKAYEYLAIGKPVVSLPMDEITPFADVVAIVSRSEFAAALEGARAADSESKTAHRIARMAGRSWGDIADRILTLANCS